MPARRSGRGVEPRAYRRLLWRPRLGLGESYVAGDWRADDLPRLFEILIRWSTAGARVAARRGSSASARIPAAPEPARARRNIGYHYDLGNDLYGLFLDESSTYSCAIWAEGDTLAQRSRKLRRVCELLELGPDDHVLEIGCGWGSFARLAAEEYGGA